MSDTDAAPPEQRREHTFHIQIDRAHYEVQEETMTGAQLRQVPLSPVPADRDLYEVRPGDDDLLLGNNDVVHIRDGLRFFTAPHHINPGAGAKLR